MNFKKDLGSLIAGNMSNVLRSAEHNKMFDKYNLSKENVNTASSQTTVEDIYKNLVTLSQRLDDFGLEKSSLGILSVANDLYLEFHKAAQAEPLPNGSTLTQPTGPSESEVEEAGLATGEETKPSGAAGASGAVGLNMNSADDNCADESCADDSCKAHDHSC